jgi:tRNA threonylcarbamoyladenosine biosynthesis protein TsaB
MGIILNLETATTNCSVSIAREGKLLAIVEENTVNYSHSEQLHPFMEEALALASISLKEIDAVAVSKGPGSYTGLRIGVSAAKGLCFSLDIPLISIPTLESMAHKIKIASGHIIPVLDARRMEVYSCVYDHSYKEVRETRAEVIDAGSFSEYLKEGTVYLAGSGAAKCKEHLDHSNLSFDIDLIPSASEMCLLSYEKFTKKNFEDMAYFEPYYLKDFILQGRKG